MLKKRTNRGENSKYMYGNISELESGYYNKYFEIILGLWVN